MSQQFDVVVIGAGPAGYVAAIRCAQLGLTTACVDQWTDHDGKPSLGGTCLNVGCIPSKALLDSSHQYHRVQHQLKAHGITIDGAAIDVKTMLARKDKIVSTLTRGIDGLFKHNKVTFIHGHGRLMTKDKIRITHREGEETVNASHVIVATGSIPIELPVAPFDGERIVDSTGALNFEQVPKRLGIVGAGVIGLELGSVWSRLGSKVIILEALPSLLPAVDQQIAKDAERQFKQQGLDIRLGTTVKGAKSTADAVTVSYTDGEGDHQLKVDRLVVAVGRRPYTEDLFAPGIGVDLDDRGYIQVDDRCQTGVPDVYAVGDVVRGPMLAHKGSEEGNAVAELVAGQSAHVNYDVIPWVIYTHPEIAWVGRAEQDLQNEGIPYNAGTFPFAATGRALAADDTAGRVKILAHQHTDEILGVHIIGPQASELVAEVVVAMEFSASAEDIARTVHAHPTLSEAVHEAALAVHKRAIHRAN